MGPPPRALRPGLELMYHTNKQRGGILWQCERIVQLCLHFRYCRSTNHLLAQAIAEVQKRMSSIPLLTEKELQIDKSTYKKAKKSVFAFLHSYAWTEVRAYCSLWSMLLCF